MEHHETASEKHEDKRPLTRQDKNPKIAEIDEACKWKDVAALRVLATSEGGLLSDEIRRQAWPLLLGFSKPKNETQSEKAQKEADSWKSLPKHQDEDQVRLDVDRSFIYYPNGQSTHELDARKRELSDLITAVLRLHPTLCYFQGYHDICQVFLLVLSPPSRVAAVSRLSLLRIRDFMLPTLAPALAQLRLIPAILLEANPALCEHLSQTNPFFALSGTLTMYAHDIQEYGDISRLFDALLAREAVFSVYLFAQIVLQRADELFDTPADETDMLHSILSKLPKPLDIEALIQNTIKLFEKHPPESLVTWRSISNFSVLRTARWPDEIAVQSLEDGEMYFQKQVKHMEWMEKKDRVLARMWKYRKPAGTIGLAVLIGVLSFWLRRPGPSGFFGGFWRRWMGYQGH